MAQKLPIEIVREILSTATEVFLLSDRATALGIALTSTLGYHAAIPILYRTVYAIEGNIQAIRYLFNNHGVAATELGKVLRIPPSQRLCPLVQRLFLGQEHRIMSQTWLTSRICNGSHLITTWMKMTSRRWHTHLHILRFWPPLTPTMESHRLRMCRTT